MTNKFVIIVASAAVVIAIIVVIVFIQNQNDRRLAALASTCDLKLNILQLAAESKQIFGFSKYDAFQKCMEGDKALNDYWATVQGK